MQIITKAQADFIETFGGNKNKAVQYTLRWGWGWGDYLVDGKSYQYESEDTKPFSMGDKLMIIDAIINGYEVKKDEKWVLATDVFAKGERVTIYYQGTLYVPTDNLKEARKFNSKEEAEDTKALMKLNKDYSAIPIND